MLSKRLPKPSDPPAWLEGRKASQLVQKPNAIKRWYLSYMCSLRSDCWALGLQRLDLTFPRAEDLPIEAKPFTSSLRCFRLVVASKFSAPLRQVELFKSSAYLEIITLENISLVFKSAEAASTALASFF